MNMLQPMSFRLCVYCGARSGVSDAYADAARRLGHALASSGGELVYGGGRVGLMGIVADAALAAGGRVVGIIPESLLKREVGHAGLTELRVVPDMHQRKRLMAEGTDAFMALPGGIGTMEELFETWTWRQLGYHDQPIGLLNVGGYFDPLLGFVDRMAGEGFLDLRQRDLLLLGEQPEALLGRLREAARCATAPDDYSKI